MEPDTRVVRAIPTDPSIRSGESLFLSETAPQGDASRSLLGVETIDPPEHLLHLAGTGRLIVRRRLMWLDGKPVRLSSSYFPEGAPEASILRAGQFVKGGLQQLFRAHGRRFGSAEESFSARMPSVLEVDLLNMQQDDPVVEIIRASFDSTGALVHILESICVASRHLFKVVQMPGDEVF